VIGINTAIVAAGQGIGFSIPINEAKLVMGQLIARGKVTRGWLGIAIQDLTDELATSFGVREREGVLVADVMKGGPGEAAGLKPGDVIVQLGTTKIREVPDLQRRVANVAPGQTIGLGVIRDRTPQRLTVRVGEMPAEDTTAAEVDAGPDGFGLQVEPLAPDRAERLGLPFSHGLLVTDVASGGPGERAGLRRGDVILEVDRRPGHDAPALQKALSAVPAGRSVVTGDRVTDIRAAAACEIGFVFGVLATVTGSIWASFEWNSFWNWDPRETSILILLMIYGAYFALRSAVGSGDSRARLSAVYAILAFLTVPFLVFLVPRMVDSLHPAPIVDSRGKMHMDRELLLVFLGSLACFTALFFWILDLRVTVTRIRERC
jgi:membrane-associated protease RseP (regulator of RpoE activity)